MVKHTQRNIAFVIFGVIIIGSFIFLANETASGEIDIRLPPPAQLTDAGFEPISLPNQQGTFVEATGINCKVKQTTIVVGQRGNLIGEIDRFDSGGIQGSPFVGLAFTFSLQDEEVSHFQIEPKVFCSEGNNLPVEVFVNQLQVLTNGRFLGTSQTLDTQNIFGSRLLNFGQGQGEQRIEQFIITATELEATLPEQNFPATYDFHVIGTLNVQYRDFPSIVYQIPILFGELQTSYIVNIIKDPFVEPPTPTLVDTDGDGILDSVDQCPTVPETKNGFQDGDGCPDTVPITCGINQMPILDNQGNTVGCTAIIVPPTPLTCQATGDAKLCMIECVNAGNEWKVINGQEVCVQGMTLNGVTITTTSEEIFLSGQLRSRTTVTYTDGSADQIVGDFTTSNFVGQTGQIFPTLELTGSTTGLTEKVVDDITYELFYTFQDTSIAQSISLTDSDIFFRPTVIVSSVQQQVGTNIPQTGDVLGFGSPITQIGSGVILGEITITSETIEALARNAGVTEGQARKINIQLDVMGEFQLTRGSDSQRFGVQDTFIRLIDFTFNNEVVPVTGDGITCPPNTVPRLDSQGETIACDPIEVTTPTCTTPERPQGFRCDQSFIDIFCVGGDTNNCSEPDRDNDGFVDILDNCPNTPSTINEGCPVGQTIDDPPCNSIIDGICVLGDMIFEEDTSGGQVCSILTPQNCTPPPEGELDLNSLLVIGGIGLIIIAIIVVIVRRR